MNNLFAEWRDRSPAIQRCRKLLTSDRKGDKRCRRGWKVMSSATRHRCERLGYTHVLSYCCSLYRGVAHLWLTPFPDRRAGPSVGWGMVWPCSWQHKQTTPFRLPYFPVYKAHLCIRRTPQFSQVFMQKLIYKTHRCIRRTYIHSLSAKKLHNVQLSEHCKMPYLRF